jgi:hypothetical protein
METFEADKAVERYDALVAEMQGCKMELQATRTELDQANANIREADKELKRLQKDLQAKCDEYEATKHKPETWKDMDIKRRSHTKSTIDGLRLEMDNLLKVKPLLSFS